MIKVVFFASLKEKLGCENLTVEFYDGIDLDKLKHSLMQRSETWKVALSNKILVAVDQEMVHSNLNLEDGVEVAFFPPVTGG